LRGRRGRDLMQSMHINAYHNVKFESRSWQGALDTSLCDKVCQWFAAGRWFSPYSPVSSTSKTDHHDITEILLNVALNNTNKININSLVDVIYLSIYIYCSSPPGVFRRYHTYGCDWRTSWCYWCFDYRHCWPTVLTEVRYISKHQSINQRR
jgi:hypothetical protein